MSQSIFDFAMGAGGTLLITLGMIYQFMRWWTKKVIGTLERMDRREEGFLVAIQEITRVLKSLDQKHTPERADGAGFGTERLNERVTVIDTNLRQHMQATEEARKEHEKTHELIVGLIRQASNRGG